MVKLVIIFLLTTLTIPQSQGNFSESTGETTLEQRSSSSKDWTELATSSTSSNSSTSPIIITDTTKEHRTVPSFSTSETEDSITTTTVEFTTSKSRSSETLSETSEQTDATSNTSSAISDVTAEPSSTLLFRCDFSSPCFGDDQLSITDGTEFNPPTISSDTQPPRAPFSDVTSITEQTSNNKICQLPYQPRLNNSTETTIWNMSFCYRQHCPTATDETATCASGSYGLVSLNALKTSKTVSQVFKLIDLSGDSINEERLRFYYYFTVFTNEANWGQEIQIWIKPTNQTTKQFSLGNLTMEDMKENKWQSRELIFPLPLNEYTLEFVFMIDASNSTENVELNGTIYFALDNIELYNCNYPYLISTTTSPMQTTTSPMQTTTSPVQTTTADEKPSPPSEHGSDSGKIIGLSLGIGIPVLFVFLGGIVLYKRKDQGKYMSSDDVPLTKSHPRENNDIFSNPNFF